jgi:hypothetical protein
MRRNTLRYCALRTFNKRPGCTTGAIAFNLGGNPRHCEEQSDEAIHSFIARSEMDCFASLAMTFSPELAADN